MMSAPNPWCMNTCLRARPAKPEIFSFSWCHCLPISLHFLCLSFPSALRWQWVVGMLTLEGRPKKDHSEKPAKPRKPSPSPLSLILDVCALLNSSAGFQEQHWVPKPAPQGGLGLRGAAKPTGSQIKESAESRLSILNRGGWWWIGGWLLTSQSCISASRLTAGIDSSTIVTLIRNKCHIRWMEMMLPTPNSSSPRLTRTRLSNHHQLAARFAEGRTCFADFQPVLSSLAHYASKYLGEHITVHPSSFH